jgi:flagellar biosynthesis/type III secretory pathway protein FliH
MITRIAFDGPPLVLAPSDHHSPANYSIMPLLFKRNAKRPDPQVSSDSEGASAIRTSAAPRDSVDDVQPSENEPLVQWEDMLEASRRTIAQAEEQADLILAQARSEAEAIRDNALRDALAEAGETIDRRVADQLEQLQQQHQNSVANSLDQLRSECHRAVLEWAEEWTRHTADLAIAIAEKFVPLRLQEDPALISSWLARAMRQLPQEAVVEIHVHPDLLAQLPSEAAGQGSASWPRVTRWIADPQIAPTEAVLEHSQGRIDLRWDSILRQLKDTLR